MTAGGSTSSAKTAWVTEATDLVRAASGGLLFGIPLVFTVEVMWTGQHTSPQRMLAVLMLSLLPLLALNLTDGFRSKRDTHVVDAVMDSIEGVAIGILLAVATLVLLGEIHAETPIRVALGKIVYVVMPFCIGIGVARHILRGSHRDGDPNLRERTTLNATAMDIGASAIGSVFIALSIAPTDEVPMLAASRNPTWLLAIMAVSLVIAYAIVFVAGFSGQSDRHAQTGLLQHPLTETVVSYIVALGSAYLMLAIFQRSEGPWQLTLSHVIVLGLPAAIGGAAGRLAV